MRIQLLGGPMAAGCVTVTHPQRCSYYDGDRVPELGTAVWDPEEGGYAARVADRDEAYSCGTECCGTEIFAVVLLRPGDMVASDD